MTNLNPPKIIHSALLYLENEKLICKTEDATPTNNTGGLLTTNAGCFTSVGEITVDMRTFTGKIIYSDNHISCYKNGKLHHDENPAVEDFNLKTKKWYQNGQLHRVNGPAFESKFVKIWYNEGQMHREDGPAYENTNGKKEYWLNDLCYTKEEFDKKTRTRGKTLDVIFVDEKTRFDNEKVAKAFLGNAFSDNHKPIVDFNVGVIQRTFDISFANEVIEPKSNATIKASTCTKCNIVNEYIDYNPNYICYECKH